MVPGLAAMSAHDRDAMVEEQIVARGVRDPAVLAAMRSVVREQFVPPELHAQAYDDRPLPIGEGQTISQPYMVARMIELAALKPGERVLEVGTGCGYAAAVMSLIAAQVFTVERLPGLAQDAARRLEHLGYDNIEVTHGDGTVGWVQRGPFDVIIAAAGGPQVPEPLKDQLALGGRLVMPVGEMLNRQRLVIVRRGAEGFIEEKGEPVSFVPLVGARGWDERLL